MKIFSPRKLNELLSDPRVRPQGVAKVAKIANSALHSMRTGQKEPKINTLAAVAHALDKPIDYFLEEESLVHQEQMLLDTRSVSNG